MPDVYFLKLLFLSLSRHLNQGICPYRNFWLQSYEEIMKPPKEECVKEMLNHEKHLTRTLGHSVTLHSLSKNNKKNRDYELHLNSATL